MTADVLNIRNGKSIPDASLHQLAIAFIRAIDADLSDDQNELKARGLLQTLVSTPAKTMQGAIYKISAAAAYANTRLDENHPVTVALGSALNDINALPKQ